MNTEQENELEPIVRELRDKAAGYQRELDELTSRTDGISARLRQIQSAISTLQGGPIGKHSGAKLRGKKPVPSREQVRLVVERVLNEKGSIKRQPLEELVNARLLADGFSRLGVGKHLKAILELHYMADHESES